MKSPSPTPSSSASAAPTTTSSSSVKFLPDTFTPSPNEVIVGRGKKIATHAGNQRLKSLVHDRLEEYEHANDKTHKTYIISQIFHEIRRSSSVGGFVKRDALSGSWYSVRDPTARTNIAQSFRDALHDVYRSSKASKQRKRLTGLQQMQEGTSVNHGNGAMMMGGMGMPSFSAGQAGNMMPMQMPLNNMGGMNMGMGMAPSFPQNTNSNSLQEQTIQLMVRYNFEQSMMRQQQQPNVVAPMSMPTPMQNFGMPRRPTPPVHRVSGGSTSSNNNKGYSITDILSKALDMTRTVEREFPGEQEQHQYQQQVQEDEEDDGGFSCTFVPTDECNPVDNPFEPIPMHPAMGGQW